MEYYLAQRENQEQEEEYSLKENFNEMEDEWNEPQFQEYSLIMEVSIGSPERADELEKLLPNNTANLKIALLRRKEYPDQELGGN